MNERTETVVGSAQSAPPVKATWVLLITTWALFLIPIPGTGVIGWVINFAAFIMAIVVLVRGGVLAGVVQLICSIIASPIIYFIGLAMFAQVLSTALNESSNVAANRTTPSQPTSTSQPVARIGANAAASVAARQIDLDALRLESHTRTATFATFTVGTVDSEATSSEPRRHAIAVSNIGIHGLAARPDGWTAGSDSADDSQGFGFCNISEIDVEDNNPYGPGMLFVFNNPDTSFDGGMQLWGATFSSGTDRERFRNVVANARESWLAKYPMVKERFGCPSLPRGPAK